MSRFRAAARSSERELMDDRGTDYDAFAACLRDVGRANRASGGYRPTLRFVQRALARMSSLREPVRLLDVGFGHGDVLRAIAAWSTRRGIRMTLCGIDLDPWAERAARAATPACFAIEYATADAFAFEPHRPYDLVTASLVTHHLSDVAVVELLRRMERWGRCGWFVNDLHRHVVPYRVAAVATRLTGAHPFVCNDAPLSVARAFVRADWRQLLARAQLSDVARLRWEFPFRYCIERTAGV